jgi:hypothetical protein
MIRTSVSHLLLALYIVHDVQSFSTSVPSTLTQWSPSSTVTTSTTRIEETSGNSEHNSGPNRRRMGELTPPEQVVYDLLCEMSNSSYSFRIVVIGKNGGAILESTVPCVGPIIKITQSPSTGRFELLLLPCRLFSEHFN